MNVISWILVIIGFLFIFEIPQKIYYAVKKQSNQIEEVKPDGRSYHGDDIDDD